MLKKAFLGLGLASFGMLAACAGSAPDDRDVAQADAELRSKKTCEAQKGEKSCLKANGGRCAWGDRGAGNECFYVGTVVAQPGGSSSGSSGPSLPTVCAGTSEASCLADPGCAWGDQGSGNECFYVGTVVAQPGGSSSGSSGPSLPTVCTGNASETSCLGEPGCAWGDMGAGPECFYVGPVTPF